MPGELVVEIMLGVLTVLVGVGAFFAATRANRDQARATTLAVDAAAYVRAREIYESALETLREDITNCRKEIVRVRESNDRLRGEISELRVELANARR